MTNIFFKTYIIFIGCVLFNLNITQAQAPKELPFIIGDALPDAPELSPRGKYKIGVQTLDLVNKRQIDILKTKDSVAVFYDRPLKVEVWYPAVIAEDDKNIETYSDFLGVANNSKRPLIPFTFEGRASRNAPPQYADGIFPLVVVSHGYPGSRFLMTYLTENLASKGYIVVSIDHTESTHGDATGFQSTLLNRGTDILFVINEMAERSKATPKNFLSGLVDANNTAIIGYSMGGYGVLNAAGAGYSTKLDTIFRVLTNDNRAIQTRLTNNATFKASYDPRIKAVVAFAPWGMQRGVWDAEGLQGLIVPTFFIAGSLDDISGYETGTKAIYKGTTHADRYLLTYMNARHNVAPNPPPSATLKQGVDMGEYYHYAEPAWHEQRINNINQHFVTAFLGIHLKKEAYQKYLNLNENANDKLWIGFKPRSAVGLELLQAKAAK